MRVIETGLIEDWGLSEQEIVTRGWVFSRVADGVWPHRYSRTSPLFENICLFESICEILGDPENEIISQCFMRALFRIEEWKDWTEPTRMFLSQVDIRNLIDVLFHEDVAYLLGDLANYLYHKRDTSMVARQLYDEMCDWESLRGKGNLWPLRAQDIAGENQ